MSWLQITSTVLTLGVVCTFAWFIYAWWVISRPK